MNKQLKKVAPALGIVALGVGAIATASLLDDDFAVVSNYYGIGSTLSFDEDGAVEIRESGDLEGFIDGVLTGSASFTGGSFGIGLGDFDNDGLTDYVVGGYSTESESVFVNFHKKTGPNTFAPATSVGDGYDSDWAADYAVADYDGDGHLDFAVAELAGANVRIYMGNGDGTFSEPDIKPLPFKVVGLDAEDIDNDGDADFVGPKFARSPTGNELWAREIVVFLGNGDGTFVQSTQTLEHWEDDMAAKFRRQVWGISLSDFTSDGIPDMVLSNYWGEDNSQITSRFSLYRGKGDGTFETEEGRTETGDAGVIGSALDDGDFNADGNRDILASNPGRSVTVFFGDGNGNFAQSTLGQNADGTEEVARIQDATMALSTLPFRAAAPNPTCDPAIPCDCDGESDADGDGIPDCEEAKLTLTSGRSHVRFNGARSFALFTGAMELPGGLLAPDFREGTDAASGSVNVDFAGIDGESPYEKNDIPFAVTDTCNSSSSDNREKWVFKGEARERITLRWKNSQKYRSDNEVKDVDGVEVLAMPALTEDGNLGLLVSRFIGKDEMRLRFRWNKKTHLPLTVAIDGTILITIDEDGNVVGDVHSDGDPPVPDTNNNVIPTPEMFEVLKRDGETTRKRVVDIVFPGHLGDGEVVSWHDGLSAESPELHAHDAIDDGKATAVFYNAGGIYRVKVPLTAATATALQAFSAEGREDDRTATLTIQAGGAGTEKAIEGTATFAGYTVDGNHWRLAEVEEDNTPTLLSSTFKGLAHCSTCTKETVATLGQNGMSGFKFKVKRVETITDASFVLRSDVNHTGNLRAYLCQLDLLDMPSIELENVVQSVDLDYRERVRFTFSGNTVLDPLEDYAVVLKNESGETVHILGGDHCHGNQAGFALISPENNWIPADPNDESAAYPAASVRGLRFP